VARIVIVGGGVIGSAIAYFLASNPDFDGEVVVVERDGSYARASSALSAGSIRQQFSSPVNIAMSQFGLGFLRQIGDVLAVDGERPDVHFNERGYLYLVPAQGEVNLRRNHAVQREHGADVALFTPEALAARYPWLSVEGVAVASLGLSGEGWFDGFALQQAFRRKARSLGAVYHAAELTAFERRGERLVAARLSDGTRLAFDHAVNAAGPWASSVARMAGVELPVRARRRCVFVFSCREAIDGCPLVIDPSGLWFRPEGPMYITGCPPADDADDLPLEVDYGLWESVVWPVLANRVRAFEAVKLHSAWAGYYEYNVFDQNAILGTHPGCSNLCFANGFSGHGLQQAPAVGRGISERLIYGGYRALDLSPLDFARVVADDPLIELNII